VGISAALLLETQRSDPLLIDEQGVLRRLQTRCFPETSEKFAGQRVQRGDADPFGRDGCGHDRNAAGAVRPPGANLDFSGAGAGRSGSLCIHPADNVVLDHSVAVAHCPSACRSAAGGKPELRRHYGEETSSGRGAITLLTFNVRSFYNDRGQWSFDGVTEVIRRVNPDIVCLQEFNRTLSKAEELDSLLSDYDRTVVMEGNGGDPLFPLALYTKYRILGKSHSILGPMKQDGQSVWVDLLVGDDTVRVFNNHLHSTAITVHDDKYLSEHQFLTDTAGGAKIKNIFRRFRDNSMLRAAQADTIARAIAATPGCKIVCGDFNDTPMSYTYRTMAQDLDDAFRASGKGYSYTFRGFMDVLRIDYVLYSEDLECFDYQVLYDVDLSDHYPVVVRLRPVKK
jgi:endonuclease/exonuclease/phosphatase family metal-dependent hydrolase